MNTWTTPLRTGLPLTYDGEQFTIAEIEGRRILLQQISAEGRPTWRQIDLSVLIGPSLHRVLGGNFARTDGGRSDAG
ncbi:hypothetical protein [Streptomyces tailanensis]|uniref:hypothetical protein n=1 Tax=Streptomyces tailanensis TaxID=2569858 RepID=UPI00122E87EC|nr:hypothetical protein [Streptomyces tailanensis]